VHAATATTRTTRDTASPASPVAEPLSDPLQPFLEADLQPGAAPHWTESLRRGSRGLANELARPP